MKVTVDDILRLPFLSRPLDERLRIAEEGKPRPVLQMTSAITMKQDGDGFSTQEFHLGLYDEIQWLTGCEKRNTFYCWPCLLFMPAVGLWNTTGVGEIVHFLEGKTKHEEAFEHTQSCLKLHDMIEQNARASILDTGEYNEMVKRNREILRRMTDVVCNLIAKEKSFYERINNCELDPENCVKNLQFLRRYDVLNMNHIEDAIALLEISPNIVNDLVQTVSKGIKLAIKKEIQQSTYVSIILSDHSKIQENSQISTVLRYIKGGAPCEKFIGFLNVGNRKWMSTVYEHISNVINEFAFSERFLALSIDGGILQTEDVIALYDTMKNVYPHTFFVPWCGHSVAHVLQQSLSNIKKCSAFFKAMNDLKIYFHKKSKRFKALEKFMAFNVPATKGEKWFVRSQLFQVVQYYRTHFIQFFEMVQQSSAMYEPDDVTKALGFIHILEDFHTRFLLLTFTKLFEHIFVLNKILKSSVPEKIINSREALAAVTDLTAARDTGFNDLWSEFLSKNQQDHLVPTRRGLPLPKKIKIDLDDVNVDEYRDLYESIVNRMIQEVENRFVNLKTLSFCQILSCDKSGKFLPSNDLIHALMNAHGSYFDEEQIRNELIVLRTNGTVFGKKSVYEILRFFTQAKLKDTFKYVHKLSELILTMPIKPPSDGNGRSKIKEIKGWSYIPQVAGENNPGDVSLPCIELEFLQNLKKSTSFHDEIAVTFYEINKTFELLYK